MRRPSTTLSTTLLAMLLFATTSSARPDEPGSDLFTFNVGDVVDTFDTEHFRLHYTTTASPHRVPTVDADENGTPDYVEGVAAVYEEALAAYTLMGFKAPVSDANTANNGGDARFDVYLVDFARQADGAYRREVCEGAICSGYMVQENDFVGYNYPNTVVANRTVASHELFHAIQAAYDANQGAVIAEGTAVWASEQFDSTLFDLEGFAYGYLDDADTPLSAGSTGPVASFNYGTGIFFQYLTERFDDALVREIWESVDDTVHPTADWFEELEPLLAVRDSSFAEAFAEFSLWTLFTGDFADPSRAFASGALMVEREGLPRALPVNEQSFTVFSASSRLLAVDVDAAKDVHIAWHAPQGGIAVFAVPVFGGALGDVVTPIDHALGAASTIDVELARTLLVLVVNTNADGPSQRPKLCVGVDTESIDPCDFLAIIEPPIEEDPELTLNRPLGCASSSLSGGAFPLAFVLLLRRRRGV